jgi:short-subunit dehydrogenase
MNQSKRFENKVVVITGATAGIGRAITEAFAREGAHIAAIARNQERLTSLQNELEHFQGKNMVFALDVSDATVVYAAAERIENELGPIDIWINNAMVSVFSPVREMTADEYRRVTDVTYLGVVYGTLAALKYMLPRNEGMIIQVGSALAYRGIPLQSAYCAAKHAVQGFHDSLLTELLHDKSAVKATMIQLSAHNTPQFDWVRSRLPNKAKPVPPIYQPEVAAKAVLWAARHYKREHIIGFPAWKAIYGNHFFPAYADKYLAAMGYESQQSNEWKEQSEADNLFEPAAGKVTAHGRFDSEARQKDYFFEMTKYIPFHYVIAGIMLLIVLLLTFALD